MDVIDADPQIASEVLAMMARELKGSRQNVKDLEAAEKSSKIYIQKLENRTVAAEKLVAKLTDELQTVSEKLSEAELKIVKIGDEMKESKNTRDTEQDVEEEERTTALNTRVNDLECALEKYYGKYQAIKVENKTLNTSFNESQKRIIQMEKDLLAQANAKLIEPKPIPPAILKTSAQLKHDIIKHLSSLPKVTSRPGNGQLQPICGRNVDLRAHLQLDPNVGAEVAKNFLYLPDRVYWCPGPGLHALGVGTLQTVNPGNMIWTSQKPKFESLYGRTFHLFFSTKNDIYYAGQYMALDLRHMGTEGHADMPVELADMGGIGVTTIRPFVKDTGTTRRIKNLLNGLYRSQAMKGELLGLQCVGFDRSIYDELKANFISTVGRNEDYFPADVAGPPVKKRRTQ